MQRLAATPITPENHLALATELRQEVSREEAHALLETALLRQKAAGKFERAAAMYFTRTGLEQASSQAVAEYRAARFAQAGLQRVTDLACGIGGDSLALCAQAQVLGVDKDPLRLAMARQNVGTYQRREKFQPLQADLKELPPLSVQAFHCDPGRRDERGRRLYSVHDYRPPLPDLLERWLPDVPNGAVKVSPGIAYGEIPQEAEVEFVSEQGQVKEGTLWFGTLQSGAKRRATLLPGGDSLSNLQNTGAPVPLSQPLEYLYEPDGAVIRAHLVETLAQQIGARKIDDDIAYLTAEAARSTPFARCFKIDHAMPFHLKQLRHHLRQAGVGRVVVKKRGSPIAPEELQRRLQLEGEEEAIVFLTHVRSQPFVLIGREVREGEFRLQG